MATVVSNQRLAPNIYKMIIASSKVAIMQVPGQFINIRIGQGKEFVLRRPISICDINKDKQEFTIIYRSQGAGTQALSKLPPHSTIDILAPLGTGYDIQSLQAGQTALLVGGGIGIPPLYELAKQFKQRGVKCIIVLGFNRQEDLFYVSEFETLGQTIICTMDGSYGFKGLVTQAIEKKQLNFDAYYACGPTPMLQALAKQLAAKPGYISLEERMACGIGACYACVCSDADGHIKRICYDGPVFNAKDLTWE